MEEIKNRRNEGNLIPVYREIVADLETPVSAFLKINRHGYSFLLESVEGGQHLGRYSFIGTEPRKVTAITEKDGKNPLEVISRELNRFRVIPLRDLPRFAGGAVGYLSYECVRHFEKIPTPDADPVQVPEAIFMLVDTLLIFDHVLHKIKVISHVSLDEDIEHSYQEAINKIEDLILRLKQPLPFCPESGRTSARTGNPTASSREWFEDSVRRIKQFINAGEVIQVVLSQRLARPTSANPFEIYRALRTINPSPYMYYLDFQDFQIIGSSPEILVRVENGMVTTRPLAGTRPRGATQEEDTALEQELRNDVKEKAEHIMLVDLGRNDIGRVSEPGSVVVSELMGIERYSHVMHMVTNVQGKLRRDMTVFDALRACFPAGTVSGAPKIRAMELIAQFEPEKRGPYAGACGYFSFSGNMDMAIAIRTIVLKHGIAYVQAGCGIVYDSVPDKEYVETLNKAQALVKAIDQAENL
ncbi:MAG: anthranilate synthase component I [Dehalococcoidales bacterium]|nr:anthranilate synthase component I [Dehalococcoidales bacterium]